MITSHLQFEWKLIFSWERFSFNNNNWLNFYSLLTFNKAFAKYVRINCSQQKKFVTEITNSFLVPAKLYSKVGLVPSFKLGFQWPAPYKTSLVGYFMRSECYENAIYTFERKLLSGRFVVKFIVILGNIWLFYFACCGACFILTTAHIFSTMIIQENIKLF